MSCLHHLLASQAERIPGETAAVYGAESLTFRQLEDRATEVARGLRAAEVGPADRVGLCMSRSLELLPAIFGILQTGAACVPVDPEDPPERRDAILDDAEVRVLVGDGSGAGTRGGGRELDVADLLRGDHPCRRCADVSPESTAFIFYTSGSTGRPKGVVLSHAALVSGQRWLAETFPLEPGARQLLRTTLSVTNLVREVFWPVLAGGTIAIVPPNQHKDPDRLVELVNEYEVATLLVVPALLSGMLENPAFRANRSLRHVFCSSDVMPGDLAERYFATGVSARLYNLYGLTEALYCSYWECRPDDRYEGFVPVGYPAELTPRVLDDDLAPVPAGEVGELCLTGVGIADGYYKQPELTAEKFVDHSDGRLYRTGDLARQSEDRPLELLGRIDDQVKIAGHRVELGEVEAALRGVDGIDAAVAGVQRGIGGHQRLIAYLVPSDPARLRAKAIRDSLAGALPDYMIPAAFVVVDAIPLTHNAKVDRAALRGLSGRALELAEEYTPPRSDLERYLCDRWAEVLELPQVGVHDNFFALGGDSIQGFMIGAKAHRDGLTIPATQVFETPTVAEMARAAEEANAGAAVRIAPGAPGTPGGPTGRVVEVPDAVRHASQDPEGIETLYPLTDMQKGMLFHSLLDPRSGVYFEQFVYELRRELDLDAYQRVWQQVVDRHEILRVWIAFSGMDEPLQVVQRCAPLECTVLDWSEAAPDTHDSLLEDYVRGDRARGFAYDRAPLFRLTLVRLGERRVKLVMSYHHLILDAWSLFVLLRDSLELYTAAAGGSAPELGPTRSFGDYVAFLEREDHDAARAYWEERLAGFRSPTIVGNAAKLGLSASDLDMHSETRLELGPELSARLLEYGRDRRLTLNSLVQGAWTLVLGRFSRQTDVCFGITITHRPVEIEGIENLVGIFINSLPMRLDLDLDQPVDEWLHGVQRVQVGARAYESYPLPLIQQRTELPSDEPLFETLLIFENFPRGSGWTGKGGIDVRQDRYIGWTNYPFAIEAMPEDELFFQVKYDRAFFDPDRVARVLSGFRDVLDRIASGADLTIGDLVAAAPADAEATAGDGRAAARTAELPSRREVVQPEGEVRPPSTPEEEALERIWAEVLDLDRVDVHTRFLALGGNSLRAMRILALAEEEGFEFELAQLFGQEGTIHQLAATASLVSA